MTITWQETDLFTKAYVEAALWSSTLDDGTPMDKDYDQFSLADSTLEQMAEDCQRFQELCRAELAEDNRTADRASYGCTVEESAGHDFWLTRNGHGAGFWDGDWTEPAAGRLTEVSKDFGGCDLYVGDYGKIYIG